MTRRRPRGTKIGPCTNIHRDRGAWTVYVERRGRVYPGHFADNVWGGRERALLAARHFRDRLYLRIDADTRVRRRAAKGTRSKTSVVGVTRERYVVGGRVYVRDVASWRDADKRTRRRRFSVTLYGNKTAKALAVKARKVGVARSRAVRLARQRDEARLRLRNAPPMPRQVKDPLDRKGISMARRRPRRVK
jgi:hypothetical protein